MAEWLPTVGGGTNATRARGVSFPPRPKGAGSGAGDAGAEVRRAGGQTTVTLVRVESVTRSLRHAPHYRAVASRRV